MPARSLTIEDRLRRRLGDAMLTQEPLRHHTTVRIGGPAAFYFAARDAHQLVESLKVAHELELPVFLLGGGSNLLVSDDGFHGLVVRNAIEGVEFDGTAAQVGCGTDFLELIHACRDRGLSGLEFAAGIPGSVGGALYGNAGCYGEDIGSFTIECTIASFDGATVVTRPASWFEFAYRDSRLKRDPWVLMSCLLQFRAGDRAAIQAVIDEKLEIRRVKHPQWRVEPTNGSYFKNLPPGFQVPGLPHSPGTHRIPAGALLDACGCRGLRVGDAVVYAKHANIIVNAGRATAKDVLTLAAMMKSRVMDKFGVTLEEEVMFLGERPRIGVVGD